MFKLKNKNYIIVGALLFILSSASVYAAGSYDFIEKSGLKNTADNAGYETASATTINGIMSQVIYVFLGLIAIAFFGLLLYGGLMWMTARDNAEKVKKANGIIMNALIGFIVTLSAYVISYFIIKYFN